MVTKLNNPIEFKLVKNILILLLFQISTSLFVVVVLYILSFVVGLLPEAILNRSPSGIVGLYVGSMYFGLWTEKKYPNMLDKDKINRISYVSSLIQVAVVGVIIVSLYYEMSDFNLMLILSFFLVFGMTILYFVTKYSISRGIKQRLRLIKRNAASS